MQWRSYKIISPSHNPSPSIARVPGKIGNDYPGARRFAAGCPVASGWRKVYPAREPVEGCALTPPGDSGKIGDAQIFVYPSATSPTLSNIRRQFRECRTITHGRPHEHRLLKHRVSG